MIYQLQVSTAQNIDDFLKEIDNRLKWIRQRGYELKVEVLPIKDSKNRLVSFALYDNNLQDSTFRKEDIIYIFRHQVAEVLAEHIVNDWEPELILKAVLKSYRKFSPEDRNILYKKSCDFLRRCHENESLNMLMNFGRKNRIAHRILEYIDQNQLLVVEGFINFCMRDYLTEIKFAVEVAAEELKNEKEYNDFVNLLKYFVDTQAPRIKEVNLLINGNGLFYLWDHKGCKIEDQYVQHYIDDLLLDDLSIDDLLISILISIAPRRIIIHHSTDLPQNDSLEIIKNVFSDKIIFCSGCKHCCPYLYEIGPGSKGK